VSCTDPTCFNTATGTLVALSPLNTGKLTVIYLPDSTGTLVDGDDSQLYVGFDIFNGDRRAVGNPGPAEDGDTHFIDFVDSNANGDICEEGVADFDLNGSPDFCAVPFDVDGDGGARSMTRWNGLAGCVNLPSNAMDRSPEVYEVDLYVCQGCSPAPPRTVHWHDSVVRTSQHAGRRRDSAERPGLPLPGSGRCAGSDLPRGRHAADVPRNSGR
jgi:hypothetical protein